MFNRQAPNAAQPRPGGAEYGYQPPDQTPGPSSRPVPQGYTAYSAVEQQLSGLVDAVSYPPAAPVPAMPEPGPNEVFLSRPYSAHDVELRKVEFREPTGAEYRKYGPPIRYVERSDGVAIEFCTSPDIAIVAKYAVELSKPPIPLSTFDAMNVQDVNAISRVICAFFQ